MNKFPTVKHPSGLEVNLAAWLLKLASRDATRNRRVSITSSGVKDTETQAFHFQKEERYERESLQRLLERIQR